MTIAPEYANPTRFDALRSQWPGALAELEPETVGVIRRAMDGFDPREGAAVEIAGAPEGGWRVGVCVGDRPGTLALVAGTLTAHGLDITNADTFTVRPAHPHPNLPPSRGKGFPRARSRRGYGQRRRSPFGRSRPAARSATVRSRLWRSTFGLIGGAARRTGTELVDRSWSPSGGAWRRSRDTESARLRTWRSGWRSRYARRWR